MPVLLEVRCGSLLVWGSGDRVELVTLGVNWHGPLVLGEGGDGLVTQVDEHLVNETGILMYDETVIVHETGEDADVLEVDWLYLQLKNKIENLQV